MYAVLTANIYVLFFLHIFHINPNVTKIVHTPPLQKLGFCSCICNSNNRFATTNNNFYRKMMAWSRAKCCCIIIQSLLKHIVYEINYNINGIKSVEVRRDKFQTKIVGFRAPLWLFAFERIIHSSREFLVSYLNIPTCFLCTLSAQVPTGLWK